MFGIFSRRTNDTVKLPNHILLYGIVLTALGVFVLLGSLTRLVELREFFPFRLPDQINEFILNYIPFIVGTFITTVAALAGVMVGMSWMLGGFRHMSRLRVILQNPGDYHRPESVSLGLKDGRISSYDKAPSLIFFLLGRIWSNARYISEIPGEIVRRNIRFIWKALIAAIGIHFLFKFLDHLPQYLSDAGWGVGYVIPSAAPFFNLLAVVCILKFIITLSFIPLKRPGASREMDSMIVEGKGHPSLFFAVLEEGSRIFSYRGFPNRIARSRPMLCNDGETLIGTLIESFPEYVKTSCRPTAVLSLVLGAVMVLIGFLQIVLMQYPGFSVAYDDFFRLYALNIVADLLLNVTIILLGKSFLDQARSLMAMYRFRSSLVYLEAKGDFEGKVLPDLKGIVAPERLFNPLQQCAFNVRFFSGEAISESVTPEGVRELVGMETSGRLAKDVGRLKFLPFQVNFEERYPSAWQSYKEEPPEETDELVIEATPVPSGPEGEPACKAAASNGM